MAPELAARALVPARSGSRHAPASGPDDWSILANFEKAPEVAWLKKCFPWQTPTLGGRACAPCAKNDREAMEKLDATSIPHRKSSSPTSIFVTPWPGSAAAGGNRLGIQLVIVLAAARNVAGADGRSAAQRRGYTAAPRGRAFRAGGGQWMWRG